MYITVRFVCLKQFALSKEKQNLGSEKDFNTITTWRIDSIKLVIVLVAKISYCLMVNGVWYRFPLRMRTNPCGAIWKQKFILKICYSHVISRNLQRNSTVERCLLAKYASSLHFPDVFFTYQTDFINWHLARVELHCKLWEKFAPCDRAFSITNV
jgi:hypothetical protein